MEKFFMEGSGPRAVFNFAKSVSMSVHRLTCHVTCGSHYLCSIIKVVLRSIALLISDSELSQRARETENHVFVCGPVFLFSLRMLKARPITSMIMTTPKIVGMYNSKSCIPLCIFLASAIP